MSVILLVVGILVTGAGLVATGFGVPINESAVGQTLIIAGVTGFVGGLALIGLAAAVAHLAMIAEALKTRPPVRGAVPADIKHSDVIRQPAEVVRQAPELRQPADVRRKVEPPLAEPRAPAPRPVEPRLAEPAPTADASNNAIERLRATVARTDEVMTEVEQVPLSPNGNNHAESPIEARAEPRPEPRPEPKAEPVARSGANVETPLKEPRLDFLFRPKSARPQQPESFDAMWPKRGGRNGQDTKAEEIARQPTVEPPQAEERRAPPPPAPAPAEPGRSVAILKSGVVDGMAYTLYADGSIEAQLPHGTVRFGSIAELRAHIENNS